MSGGLLSVARDRAGKWRLLWDWRGKGVVCHSSTVLWGPAKILKNLHTKQTVTSRTWSVVCSIWQKRCKKKQASCVRNKHSGKASIDPGTDLRFWHYVSIVKSLCFCCVVLFFKKRTSQHPSPDLNSHGYESKFENTSQVWDEHLNVQGSETPSLGGESHSPDPWGSSFKTTTRRHHCHNTDLLWASCCMAGLPLVGEHGGKSQKDPCHHNRKKVGATLVYSLGSSEDSVCVKETVLVTYAGVYVLGRP